jgi:hypothetical protein
MKYQKNKKVRTFEGLPVIDADSDVTLEVTPQDIRIASKKNPEKCAAANAGKRELHTDVKVFLSRMYVKKSDKWVRYLTPHNASREIVSFDRGSEFEPGEYTFKAPSKTQRLGAVHNPTSKRTRTNQSERKRHVTANVRISAKESYNR